MINSLKQLLIFLISALKMPFVSLSAMMCRRSFPLEIISDKKTVEMIRDNGYSVARFGDGEFRWIMNKKDHSLFQTPSKELSESLLAALYSKKHKLLIGIPRALSNDKDYTFKAKYFWRSYLVSNKEWLQKTLPKITYCNASITRPYLDYKNKAASLSRFGLVKSIWTNRHVLIIEGSNTKFGIGNDLLNNALSIKRILAPAENSFEHYAEIKASLLKYASRDTLILLCLGPTATILAADQELESFQLVDIGHLDIEYEWCLANSKKKTAIKGKYVNEASSKGDSTYNEYLPYKDSVIDRIGL